jgi:hypothetical protein
MIRGETHIVTRRQPKTMNALLTKFWYSACPTIHRRRCRVKYDAFLVESSTLAPEIQRGFVKRIFWRFGYDITLKQWIHDHKRTPAWLHNSNLRVLPYLHTNKTQRCNKPDRYDLYIIHGQLNRLWLRWPLKIDVWAPHGQRQAPCDSSSGQYQSVWRGYIFWEFKYQYV